MRGMRRGGSWGRPRYRNRITNVRSDVSCTSRTSCVTSSIGSSKSSGAPTFRRPVTVCVENNHGPYKCWKLYFPPDENIFFSELLPKIKAVEGYIRRNISTFNVEKIKTSSNVTLDLEHLSKDNIFITDWPAYMNELSEKPEETLNCLKLAFNEVLSLYSKVQIGLINHQPVLPLSNLKVNYFGKLVTIKGTVIRVGSIGLICTAMAFKCSICHSVQAVMQPQGMFTAPSNCKACKRFAKFEAMETSPYTTTMDWQTAKLQELQSQGVSGSIPRSVEIEFIGELVGSVCPGDVLSVTGIVQVRGESKGGREDGKKAARLLQLYIEAVSIQNQRNLSHPSLAFTENDYYAIQEIYASPDVFRLLVHSLCPSIFGHEMVKAGLILGLLGGTESDGAGGPRSSPHTLVVGDPGLGKSQLLQAAVDAAPRGIYVCGASASAGGLTVALGREAGGDFALEAGALVLADKGVCCVDELDKMTAHHSSLLEAMEQGTVSVAKGGVVCSLAARATVLAAANPVGGTYNKAKTVAENIKLDSALLSRFDLVFILVDQPDERMDALLSEHVLALHSGTKSKPHSANTPANISLFETLNEETTLSHTVHSHQSKKVFLLILSKYNALKIEVERHSKTNVKIIPIVVGILKIIPKGCTRVVAKNMNTYIDELNALIKIEILQRQAALQTSLIVTKFMTGYLQELNSYDLRDRLRLRASEVMDPLPLVLLRKYVAYARRYVHPQLSADARSELQKFYLEMRRHQQGQGSAPVTARQLEACVRLTQARARADLQEEATVEHAKEVICLVKHSLIDTFSDEFGNIQLSRSINGSGVSSRSAVAAFVSAIRCASSRVGRRTWSRAELCALHARARLPGDAPALLEALNTHSYLLFKGNDHYQLTSL